MVNRLHRYLAKTSAYSGRTVRNALLLMLQNLRQEMNQTVVEKTLSSNHGFLAVARMYQLQQLPSSPPRLPRLLHLTGLFHSGRINLLGNATEQTNRWYCFPMRKKSPDEVLSAAILSPLGRDSPPPSWHDSVHLKNLRVCSIALSLRG